MSFDLLRQLGGSDLWDTIDKLEDAIGGGGGPLQSGVDAGEFPDRVDGAGQERVQQRQSRHVHHLGRQPDVPDFAGAPQHQVCAGQQGHADGRQSQQLGGRIGQRVDPHHLHRLVVVLAVLAAELLLLTGGAVEGDDHLHGMKGFLECLVDPRHALHHPVAGRLERFAVPVEDHREDRDEQKRQQGQLPVDPEGHHDAGDGLERFADHLAAHQFQPTGHHVDVIGEAGHQRRGAVLGQRLVVQRQAVFKTGLADTSHRLLDRAADQHVLDEDADSLQQRADHQQAQHQRHGVEGISRQMWQQLFAGPVESPELAGLFGDLSLQACSLLELSGRQAVQFTGGGGDLVTVPVGLLVGVFLQRLAL